MSVAVALADKLDTLAGFFAIDERPTGSKDPFALRRAALGVSDSFLKTSCSLRTLPLRLPLGDALAAGLTATATCPRSRGRSHPRRAARLLRRPAQGASAGRACATIVSAVFSAGGEDDLVRLLNRVDSARSLSQVGRRRQPAHRLPPGRQHPPDRGEEGRHAATTASPILRSSQEEERNLLHDKIPRGKRVDCAAQRAFEKTAFDYALTEPCSAPRPRGRLLRQRHGQLRRPCAAPQSAADALADTRHAGPGRRLLEDRGLGCPGMQA